MARKKDENDKGDDEGERERKGSEKEIKETIEIEKCIIKIIRRFFLCGIVGTSI